MNQDSRLKPTTALLALSDKSGSEVLAQALTESGGTIYGTTGTAAYLRGLGLEVEAAETITRTPEFLGGRVKTLSPDLFGAILARRDHPTDVADLSQRSIQPLDLVCVTLYPFESLPADASWEEATELIDIGGVALLRAAAKNFRDVIVLSSPSQYEEFREAMGMGGPTLEQRTAWARAAFERTAEYDSNIARFFQSRTLTEMPEKWLESFGRVRGLRYGENPHQEAALFARPGQGSFWTEGALHEGKELSFNNLLDLEAAVQLTSEFVPPSCGIIKHNEPSSLGIGETILDAFELAMKGDPLSAFGGVIAFNREIDVETARALTKHFIECVAAPGFSEDARTALSGKKRLRIVRFDPENALESEWETRPLSGGLLVQRIRPDAGEIQLQVVTQRAPTPAEMEALHFAWTIVGRARSNAVVIASAQQTLGIGSGQTSRIDALHVGLMKARRSANDVRGGVLASDGFFPFGDWVEVANEAGIIACIQPGGSMRDAESIAACDAAGIAMVFTGRRQFRH